MDERDMRPEQEERVGPEPEFAAGAAAPPAGATVPMEQTPHSESRDEKGRTLTE